MTQISKTPNNTTTWRLDDGTQQDTSRLPSVTLPSNTTWRLDNGTNPNSSQWPVVPANNTSLNQQKTNTTPTAPAPKQPYTDPSGYVWRGGYDEFVASQKAKDEFNKQLDSLYNPQYDYLNQAERNLNSDYGGVNDIAQSNYRTNQKLLDDQRLSGLENADTQLTTGAQQKESALAAARRTFNDIQRGYAQRFGSASSAREASSEIAGAEQQRQMGQIQQNYGNLVASVEKAKGDVLRAYNAGKLQLEQQLQTALATAKSDFNSKLLEIQRARSDIAGAKAQAQLSALMDYRNKMFQISQQNEQFKQALALQRERSLATANSYTSSVDSFNEMMKKAQEQAQASSYGTANTDPNLQVRGGNEQMPVSYIGQIMPKTNKDDIYSLFS